MLNIKKSDQKTQIKVFAMKLTIYSRKKSTKETDLYLVSKTWKKMHMNALLNSAPAHCLVPPPKGEKFFDITSESISYIFPSKYEKVHL